MHAGVGGITSLQKEHDQRGRHFCGQLAAELLPPAHHHQWRALLRAAGLMKTLQTH